MRRIEIALDDRGVLVEIANQRPTRSVFVYVVASALGMGLEFRRDFLLTFGGTDDDAIVLESLFVIQEVAHGNGARTEETMAASGATGGDAGDGEFQRLAIQYSDDPADGTDVARSIEAGPGHGTWPSEIVDSAGEDTN